MDWILHCKAKNHMQLITLTGIVAGTLTSLSMLPQLFKVIKEKKAENISVFAFVVLITGLLLWVVYGVMKTDWPLIITNSIAVIINLTMIILSIIYKRK
jgi:MtN3 and saliva related transmembrane protein